MNFSVTATITDERGKQGEGCSPCFSVLNLGVVGHGGANNAGGPKDLT